MKQTNVFVWADGLLDLVADLFLVEHAKLPQEEKQVSIEAGSIVKEKQRRRWLQRHPDFNNRDSYYQLSREDQVAATTPRLQQQGQLLPTLQRGSGDHGATEDWTFKTFTIICSGNYSALENLLRATAVYRP